MFLRSATILKDKTEEILYKKPFLKPIISKMDTIHFSNNVTFFVGENGSGKSTILEAIAYQCGFNTAGGGRNNTYYVESAESELGDCLRLSWLPKVTNGFFMRAESFYNFATHVDNIGSQKYYGGRSLHAQSHGEAFLSLFNNRFRNKGIFLLDEPEAALSPLRQLSFLRIIHNLSVHSQFIIATHSPILLGYPEAQIFNFDKEPISEILYEESDHYQITRRFLENRKTYLKELFDE
ncbi:MAG: AAA family ATPase [Bacillota bacterium]